MSDSDREIAQKWKEFLRIVGYPPPKIQCPGGELPPDAMERLKNRPDLVRWALGQEE